ERTYRSTRDVFDFQALAPLHLRGKSEPLSAWVVKGLRNQAWMVKGAPDYTLAVTQHPRGIMGLEAKFVGRTLELSLMHATYARVQAEKRPHLITLLGAPGIGKSRLVREFVEREQEAAKCASSAHCIASPNVLQGRCPPYGEGITYWPLVEILRTLLKVENTESYESIKNRLTEFVQETLSKANRTEDALQVAQDIARSVGGGPGEKSNESRSGSVENRERQRNTHSKNPEQSSLHTDIMRAWRVLLEALAQLQPLIIIIDDLQWADEALLDILEYLTDRITTGPVLFLCPARPDFFERRRDWGGGRRNFTTIALEALSKEESNELVDELLKTAELPGVLRYTILNRAEGNPFFVEEIVRMLIDQKVLVFEEGYWRISTKNEAILSELASPTARPEDTLIDLHYTFPLPRVPDTIQGVLAARVDLLSQIEKQVLQHAAIIGRTFWFSSLLVLAPTIAPETMLDTLDVLVERDFIVESEKQERSPVEHDRVFSFKHVLIRDVVYNNIPRMRRSIEHAQLALWLEERTQEHPELFVELLAYHYQQAYITWSATLGPGTIVVNTFSDDTEIPLSLTRAEIRRRSIIYLSMAGDQALHSYFTIRAIQAYNEALELLIDSDADGSTLAAMHEKLGNAYAQRGNLDEAWQEYQQALNLRLPDQQGDKSKVLYLYNRLAELGTRWLGLFNMNPSMQEASTYIDAGLQLLEGQPVSAQNAAFLTYQAFLYIRQMAVVPNQEKVERAEQALRSGHEALRIAEELHDTYSQWVALDALNFIYYKQHKYREALQLQYARQKLASATTSRQELHDLYYLLGRDHDRISDYPTAVKWYGEAWTIAQTMESPTVVLDSMIGRMEVWYHWNRWKDAQEVAHSILQMVEQYQQNEQWQVEALETLAVIAYRTGNQEQGDRYARQHKRILDQCGSQVEHGANKPLIYLAKEDWPRAIAGYTQKLQRSEPFPSPRVLAILAELLVITGESTEGQQTTCERAVVVSRQSGERKSLAIAFRAKGRMHLEQQHWPEAEDDLQQSLEICKELDLPWESGQTLYCLGLLYRRRADVLYTDIPTERNADLSRAHTHFEKALGYFESLNAVHNAERTRIALTQYTQAPV
ncbi:MAG: AAA family ATPase, partial [Chloroflexota bacterium]|nr:AAA family ATPase [Chloroflexota bacterium]